MNHIIGDIKYIFLPQNKLQRGLIIFKCTFMNRDQDDHWGHRTLQIYIQRLGRVTFVDMFCCIIYEDKLTVLLVKDRTHENRTIKMISFTN